MGASSFSGPLVDRGGDIAFAANAVLVQKNQVITLVNGVASGSFLMPANSNVTRITLDTPVTIPGAPTTLNLRLGSAANGAQYVADVDVKTQGAITATLLYPALNTTGSNNLWFFTVATVGGTAASQVGTVVVRIAFSYTV